MGKPLFLTSVVALLAASVLAGPAQAWERDRGWRVFHERPYGFGFGPFYQPPPAYYIPPPPVYYAPPPMVIYQQQAPPPV